MPLGDGINGSIAYDFGKRQSFAAVTAKRNLLKSGQPVDLGIRWAEGAGSNSEGTLTLDATTKPHPSHKVFASVNPRTGAALGSWQADVAVPLPEALGGSKPVSLGIARNFAKGTTSLSAARSVAGGVKAGVTYGLDDGVAVLALGRAPLAASIKAQRRSAGIGGVGGSSWGRPTVSLSIDRDLQFDTPWGRGSRAAAAREAAERKRLSEAAAARGRLGPLTDNALFRRLGEIDSLWRSSAEEKSKKPEEVKAWSFLKKK